MDIACFDYSLAAQETLYGTYKPATVWLLLEYHGRWNPEAFEDSDLPAPTKRHLQRALDTIPQSKILFIRQNPRLAPDGLAFFVALTPETDPTIYQFYLGSYDDLLDLDVAAIAHRDAAFDGARLEGELYLVCAHGRRDRCCARRGLPVYEALAQTAGAQVWQSTHLGGHRLAANVIAFPQGVAYGRATPDDAATITRAARAGQVALDLYRGRTCYPQLVQAADYFLRRETGVTDLAAYRLVSAEETAPRQWAVRFADGSATHTLQISEDPAGFMVYGSCGDAETEPKPRYDLIGYTRS